MVSKDGSQFQKTAIIGEDENESMGALNKVFTSKTSSFICVIFSDRLYSDISINKCTFLSHENIVSHFALSFWNSFNSCDQISVCAEIKLCCANPYICEIAFQSLHVHFVHVWVLCFYGSMRRYASHLTNQRVSQHFGSNLNRLTGLAPISEEDQ